MSEGAEFEALMRGAGLDSEREWRIVESHEQRMATAARVMNVMSELPDDGITLRDLTDNAACFSRGNGGNIYLSINGTNNTSGVELTPAQVAFLVAWINESEV